MNPVNPYIRETYLYYLRGLLGLELTDFSEGKMYEYFTGFTPLKNIQRRFERVGVAYNMGYDVTVFREYWMAME